MGEISIWRPGLSLDYEYPEATEEQLAAELGGMVEGDVISPKHVLGVMRAPKASEEIRGVASIDLCEVLRKSAWALVSTGGNISYNNNGYVDGLWNDPRHSDRAFTDNVITPILQVMMNNDHVPPVDGYEEIAEYMQEWREDLGIYVVANTSTLPGCELGTLKGMHKYYPNGFDGIVFPRNHDGTGKITKAAALTGVIEELEAYGQEPDFADHIDDTNHHIQGMIDNPPHENMRLYVPAYEGNLALHGLAKVVRVETPLQAFRQMDRDIREQLDRAA